jgi:hypothetical protein
MTQHIGLQQSCTDEWVDVGTGTKKVGWRFDVIHEKIKKISKKFFGELAS